MSASLSWHRHVPEAHVDVDCESGRHRLTWSDGRLVSDHHADLDAERVLVSLGGAAPPCLRVADLWEHAVSDGGFVEEWAPNLEPDGKRLWWLRTALERLRSEGVQDFLYDLPRERARIMCEAVLALPHPLLDRAAGHAVAGALDRRWDGDERLLRHVVQAVRLRARRAFVDSLATNRSHVKSAALVRFGCEVGVDVPPAVTGVLRGRSSHAAVQLDAGWLATVWARGIAVLDGRFVLRAVDAADGTIELSYIRWRGDDTALRADVGVASAVPGPALGEWMFAHEAGS